MKIKPVLSGTLLPSRTRARAYYRSLCFLLSQVSQVEITLQHYKDFGAFTEE